MKNMKILLIVGIFLNTMTQLTNAATSVSLGPVVFGRAMDDGMDGSFDGFYTDYVRIARNPDYLYGAYEARGIIEFDISSIPSNITIEDATLHLYCVSRSNLLPSINLYGYIGDGIFDSSDVYSTTNLLASGLTNLYNVNVTPFVQNLVDDSYPYAGFLGIETKNNAVSNYELNYDYDFLLNINFVPEPATLLLLGLGAVFLKKPKK